MSVVPACLLVAQGRPNSIVNQPIMPASGAGRQVSEEARHGAASALIPSAN